MGLFSRPKCPVHRTEYAIGSDGLERFYFCRQCREKAIKDRDEKKALQNKIDELERKIENLGRETRYKDSDLGF